MVDASDDVDRGSGEPAPPDEWPDREPCSLVDGPDLFVPFSDQDTRSASLAGGFTLWENAHDRQFQWGASAIIVRYVPESRLVAMRQSHENLLRTITASIDDLRQTTTQSTAEARTQILATIEEVKRDSAQAERLAYDRGIAVCIGECLRRAHATNGEAAAWAQAAEALRALYAARQTLAFTDECPSCGRPRVLSPAEPAEPLCPGWGSEDCLTATVARFDRLFKEEVAWRIGFAHAKEAIGADEHTDLVDAIVHLRERDKRRGAVLDRIRQSEGAAEPWLAELLRSAEDS